MDGLYKEFGRLLRAARKDANLTQGEVAERVGLSRTSITNIERGTQHIGLHQLFLLASAVGVGPAGLLPNQDAALEELVSPQAMKVLRSDDEELFARRVLGRSPAVRPQQRKVAEG